jgi:small conductance mechanosensitive channel
MSFWHALFSQAGSAQLWAERLLQVAVTAVVAGVLVAVAVAVERRLRAALLRRAEAEGGAPAAHVRAATTAVSLLGSIVRWLVLLLAALYVLGSLGVNLWPALTGLGFAGVALAFGAQSLVKDLVSGLFVLLEGQYAVGEYVSLNGIAGRVASLSLRTTALDTPDGRRHYFPNGSVTAVAVLPVPLAWYELTVPVETAEQAAELTGALTELAEGLRAAFPERVLQVGEAQAYGQAPAAGVRLELAVRPGYEWLATEELAGRAKGLLEARQIAPVGGLGPVARAGRAG